MEALYVLVFKELYLNIVNIHLHFSINHIEWLSCIQMSLKLAPCCHLKIVSKID